MLSCDSRFRYHPLVIPVCASKKNYRKNSIHGARWSPPRVVVRRPTVACLSQVHARSILLQIKIHSYLVSKKKKIHSYLHIQEYYLDHSNELSTSNWWHLESNYLKST
jgi:hypothetical protein